MRTESLHSRLGGKGILSSEEKALLGLDIESFIRRMELRIRKVIELKKRGAVAEKMLTRFCCEKKRIAIRNFYLLFFAIKETGHRL